MLPSPQPKAHMVAEGVGSDGVLGGQGHTAEDDEHQDKIGEDVMVYEGVAGLPQSGEQGMGHGQNPGPQS